MISVPCQRPGAWITQSGDESASHAVWSKFIDVSALQTGTQRGSALAREQIRLITAKHRTRLLNDV